MEPIIFHAQVQKLGGRVVEFQPNHLLCDGCWQSAEVAFVHAQLFGSAFACVTGSVLDSCDDPCGMSAEVRR